MVLDILLMIESEFIKLCVSCVRCNYWVNQLDAHPSTNHYNFIDKKIRYDTYLKRFKQFRIIISKLSKYMSYRYT